MFYKLDLKNPARHIRNSNGRDACFLGCRRHHIASEWLQSGCFASALVLKSFWNDFLLKISGVIEQ